MSGCKHCEVKKFLSFYWVKVLYTPYTGLERCHVYKKALHNFLLVFVYASDTGVIVF